MEKKIGIIVQARTASTRLPNKVLKKINGKSIIEILISRLKKIKIPIRIVVATTFDKKDDVIIEICKKLNIDFFRGSEFNVLKRYYKCAKFFDLDIVVRITADCPLSDPQLIKDIINRHIQENADYTCNRIEATYPDGLDVEVLNFEQLKSAFFNAKSDFDKEHVTPFIIRKKNIKKISFKNKVNYSNRRWTLDTYEDLLYLKILLLRFKNNMYIDWKSVINYENKNKTLLKINSMNKRNTGSIMNLGLKKWEHAKTLIPGGNSFLSKRPSLYSLDLWPTYFLKAKGVNVWDLSNRKYLDMSLMGIGTNILGYANHNINKKVIDIINKSNMSTLNCPEEVDLAELLVKMHPWSQQVKFARTGGEANSLAIRIARCNTKKNNIAICGYHGWHDWYLSANLQKKKNLENHLLKGLSIEGINKKLINTCFPFEYNKINQLQKLIKNKQIGIIFMEVSRNIEPKNNFLKKVRNIADKNKIILIFDECTSGFRETFGGLHLKYGVNPDICVFGKSLGNGFPINAIIGTRKLMSNSNNSFISSTFWSERTGYVAAIATLSEMKKIQSWKIISNLGKLVKKKWAKLLKKHKLSFRIYGLNSMPVFEINSNRFLEYKTFLIQEMLKKNILATNSIYLSTKHKLSHLSKYFRELDKILKKISEFEKKNISSVNFLKTKVCETNFQRLN